MIQEKFSAPPIKARQIILTQKIEEARNIVIDADIELDFLRSIKDKLDSEQSELINSEINELERRHDFYLEKLNHLKRVRELKRADRTARMIENSTPDTITLLDI